MKRPKTTVLLILDGWGIAPPGDGNAVTRANTPVFDSLVNKYPVMTLRASGEEVGLSWGEMGNSEVGHLTIGAGRVFYQTLPRINKAISDGEFSKREAFIKAFDHVKQNKSALHLMGIVSPGRVHGLDEHCYALLELAKEHKVKKVFVHAFLDGRDTILNSGIDFVTNLQKQMKKLRVGKIATLSGRYYAMDRDNRWDRTEKAYRAIVDGQSESTHDDPIAAIKESYQKEVYDEEFTPTVITKGGKPVAKVADGDSVIFFNYRADRARQLTKAFVLPSFDRFEHRRVANSVFVAMTEYEKGLPVEVAFTSEGLSNNLAEVLDREGYKQFHVAETEKYAHVTFFLNGKKEEPFEGETRKIIPSPHVAAYDEQPEMSAPKVCAELIKEIKAGNSDFLVANFANPDMVGHTGNIEAAMHGIEVVDECVGKVVSEVVERGGVVLITADHGNSEEMLNIATGEMSKEHSTNPVPLIIAGEKYQGKPSPAGASPDQDLSLTTPVGMLADIAPTILEIMDVDQPEEMTGQPLI